MQFWQLQDNLQDLNNGNKLTKSIIENNMNNISLSDHKTKIVATIGPASDPPEMLERLIRAGLNIARLKFSTCF